MIVGNIFLAPVVALIITEMDNKIIIKPQGTRMQCLGKGKLKNEQQNRCLAPLRIFAFTTVRNWLLLLYDKSLAYTE